MSEIQDLYRLGVKLYFKNAPDLDLAAAVGLFHGWIQNSAVPDLLIDVADYRHVEDGPGVLLIAHEGNYGLSVADSLPAFEYYQKRPGGEDPASRWSLACRKALQGARLLSQWSGAGLELDSSQLCLFTHDRLLAPNSRVTEEALMPAAVQVLDKLYAGGGYSLGVEAGPSEPFALRVSNAPVMDTAVLLSSLTG